MQIETHLAPHHAVLRLNGDFETYAIADFLDAVEEVRENDRLLVVVNMRKVKFMNSTAIGAILRARKELKAAGGGIALARSSAFVRDVLSKLGLAEVLPSYDEEEDAVEALLELVPTEQAAAIAADQDSALLFRFYGQEQADLLGGRGVGAGEIALLDVEGMTFNWSGRGKLSDDELRTLFAGGVEMELKFRLPLYSKSTYYVTDAKVDGLEILDNGARVHATFSGLDDEASKAVRQYVADMAMVREELEKARQGD